MAHLNPCPTCKETEELAAALQEYIDSLEHEIEIARAADNQIAIGKYRQALRDTRSECQQLLGHRDVHRENQAA